MVFVQIDPTGIAVAAALVVAVFVPTIGILTEKKRENNLNLIKHGFYSSAALVASLVLVFVFMIPVFLGLVNGAEGFGFLQFPVLWFHSLAGVISVFSGIILVVAWFREPLAELGCSKVWQLMIPTIALWILTLALGILVHFFGIL